MEADVLNALNARAAHFTGGRDRLGRWLIYVPVPADLQPWSKRNMELAIQYLFATMHANGNVATEGATTTPDETQFVLLVDTQKCSNRIARSTLRHIEHIVDSAPVNPDSGGSDSGLLLSIVVVRSDAFWDKQLVDNCTKAISSSGSGNGGTIGRSRRDETVTIPKSRLDKYFDVEHQLPEELGGRHTVDHERWLQKRLRIDEFQHKYDKVLNDLENVHVLLLEYKAVRAADAAYAVQHCAAAHVEVLRTIEAIISNGNSLESDLIDHTAQPPSAAGSRLIEPDLIHSRDRLQMLLNTLDAAQTNIGQAWRDFQHSIDAVQQLGQLEERIARTTNWFLGTAEQLLAAHTRIGCDVPSCEALRREHDQLELQCSEPLGAYAELLHCVKRFPLQPDTFAHKDLMSQKEFMDFVCRQFAARMERRRTVLITCARFYRLVSEYFDKTSEVFETLVLGEKKVEDFAVAAANLKMLADSQDNLDKTMRDLEKEGEKLSDFLVMPIKDALGRDCGRDYSEDIATIRDILDATLARRSIFLGSVDLQKLTLQQVTHIHAYEMDASVAHRWIGELFAVMCKTHLHVGCNVFEIQTQKDDLQSFQDTAKGTYNYGCQLLGAARTLRQSCKLSDVGNQQWLHRMNAAWSRLHSVSQEQMTRLRVSAVFYRSIDEYCEQLLDLRRTVAGRCERQHGTPDQRDEQTMRRFLVRRERLLVDVGRMVRLGRLLRTRLREPFDVPDVAASGTMADANAIDQPSAVTVTTCVLPSAFTASGNAIACEAIAAKLTEVTRIAESLDSILSELQVALDEAHADSAHPAEPAAPTKSAQGTGSIDEWSHRSSSNTGNTTEDELFVTASEGNTAASHSRSSSSYRTASEGGGSRASPWWSSPVHPISAVSHHFDADSSDSADAAEAPTMRLLSGVVPTAATTAGAASSSTSASFDGSDVSFRSTDEPPPLPPPAMRECMLDMDDVAVALIGAPKVSDGLAQGVGGDGGTERPDAQSWSRLYGNVLTKQTLKGCL